MKVKAVLLIAVILGVSLVGSSAAWAVACPTTIGAWTTCTVTDKDFTLLGTNLPLGTGLSISSPLTGVHIITFSFATLAPGGVLPPGDYFLNYTASINIPDVSFTSVSMDATVPGQSIGTVTVAKDIFDTTSNGGSNPTLATISTNGGPAGPVGLGSGVTVIEVDETFSVPAQGILTSATNTYTQSNFNVPAPASLILLGLGLTGVAFVSRRKKR